MTALADEFPRRLIARVTGWPRSSLYHEPRERADAAKLDGFRQRLPSEDDGGVDEQQGT